MQAEALLQEQGGGGHSIADPRAARPGRGIADPRAARLQSRPSTTSRCTRLSVPRARVPKLCSDRDAHRPPMHVLSTGGSLSSGGATGINFLGGSGGWTASLLDPAEEFQFNLKGAKAWRHRLGIHW